MPVHPAEDLKSATDYTARSFLLPPPYLAGAIILQGKAFKREWRTQDKPPKQKDF